MNISDEYYVRALEAVERYRDRRADVQEAADAVARRLRTTPDHGAALLAQWGSPAAGPSPGGEWGLRPPHKDSLFGL